MTNIIIVFSILFFSQTLMGQQNKDVIYLNSNNQKITLEHYDLLKKTKKYVSLRELKTDSIIYKQVFVRKNHGKLDSVQHKQLKMFLTKLIGPGFDGNKNIMIHLYSQNGKNVKKDQHLKNYWKYIKANSDEFQAYLIGEKGSEIALDKKNHTYLDSYNLLHNLFFKNSPFAINHLFIKPNGEIYIYYGGMDILEILDWSV